MGIGRYLLDLIIQPESSLKLVPVINISIILLLIVLGFLALQNEIAVVHICVMTFLALGLLCSVNWFLIEFQKVKAEQARLAADGGSSDARVDNANSEQSGNKLKSS